MAERMLRQTGDEIGVEERRVLDAIAGGNLVARDPVDLATERATLGDRLADRVAAIGGSWSVIAWPPTPSRGAASPRCRAASRR